MKKSKGFGSVIPQVEMYSHPFMGQGAHVLTGYHNDILLFEIGGVARALGKSKEHIESVIESKEVATQEVNDQTRGLMTVVSVNSISKIIVHESSIDNPYALQVQGKAIDKCLDSAYERAIAEGNDYIEFAGHKVVQAHQSTH